MFLNILKLLSSFDHQFHDILLVFFDFLTLLLVVKCDAQQVGADCC